LRRGGIKIRKEYLEMGLPNILRAGLAGADVSTPEACVPALVDGFNRDPQAPLK
jgi:hypothetical protein